MDRTIVYPSQQPTDTLWLNAERNKMIALGWLAQGVLGTNIVVDGLGCVPTTPASMAVQIGPGAIYTQVPADSISYGSLGVDTVDQIVKQGISLPVTSLTLTPPAGSGQAINYLIEAELAEQDTGSAVLSYFNSANPTIPFTGPGGSGTAQPTLRQCGINFVAKAGVPATAGAQVTPAPDAGYVGLWVVTVANGATQLTSAQISLYPGSPFIAVKLPQMPAWVQGGSYGWAVDTGTQNAMVVNLNPMPANIGAGFEMRVRKIGTASNSSMTIAVNGASPVALVAADGSAMSSTQVMPGNYLAHIAFDGTSWRFMNGITSSAIGSLSASSGEGVNVNGSGVVALNYPSLSVETNLGGADLWSFYSQGDTHHRVLSWIQLTTAIRGALSASLLNVQVITTSGTYTPTAGTKNAIAFVTGGGGAGGGSNGASGCVGGGGGGGATAIAMINMVGIPSIPATIGVGGTPSPSYGNGGNGGQSALGTYAVAGGGNGGYGSFVMSPSVAGGIATAGLLQLSGNPGSFLSNSGKGGDGGGGFWGGGGLGADANQSTTTTTTSGGTNVATAGGAGTSPGAGGGGGDSGTISAVKGGAGAAGIIVIIEFS